MYRELKDESSHKIQLKTQNSNFLNLISTKYVRVYEWNEMMNVKISLVLTMR